MRTKVCTMCKRELEAGSSYFHIKKRNKDGLAAKCKECCGSKFTIKPKKGFKFCSKCKSELIASVEYFSADNSRKDKLRIICKTCEKENHAKFIKNNKAKISDYNRFYHKKNPDKTLHRKHIRKAKMKQLPYNFSEQEWIKCKDYFNNQCAYCESKENLEREHFVPLIKGGEYTVSNIIPACKSCNSSKNDSDFFKWYPQRDYYSKKNEDKILSYLNINKLKTNKINIS